MVKKPLRFLELTLDVFSILTVTNSPSRLQNNHIAGTSSREILQKSSILQLLQLVALLRI